MRTALPVILLFTSGLPALKITDGDWSALNDYGYSGADNTVYATAYGKGRLFIGGRFSIVANTWARKIAQWDGVKWSSLGAGCNGDVYALTCDRDGNLYAAGIFDTVDGIKVDHIAKWDGVSWHALGSFPNTRIQKLACDDNGLIYAVMDVPVDSTGDYKAKRFSRWDGSSWTPLTPGINGSVNGISCCTDGSVFICGTFDTIAGVKIRRIARWDGNSWSELGGGIAGRCNAIAVSREGKVAVGGWIDTAGSTSGIQIRRLVLWDGNNWGRASLNGTPDALVEISAMQYAPDGTLFIGGRATSGFSSDFYCLYSFGLDNKWNSFGQQYYYSGTINSLSCSDSSVLFAGGNFPFYRANTTSSYGRNIIAWNGKELFSLAPKFFDGAIKCLVADPHGNVYIGGAFNDLFGTPASSIAGWNNGRFFSLGQGLSRYRTNTYQGVLDCVLDSSGSLYTAGDFTLSGSDSVKNVGVWNGTTWKSVGGGACSYAFAVAVDHNGTLYAGGSFDTIGKVIVNKTARWNGSVWEPLGVIGVSPAAGNPTWTHVLTIRFDNSDHLYIGGEYITPKGFDNSNIARWNGSSWCGVDGGIGGAFTSSEIADIAFDSFGDMFIATRKGVLQWNGNGWSGMGIDSVVSALAVDNDDNLYAGGEFSSYNHLARWDGTSWTPLGSGTDGPVTSLAIIDSILYVGGDFMVAGGNITPSFAKVNIHATPSRVTMKPHRRGSSELDISYSRTILVCHTAYTGRHRIELYTLCGKRIFATDVMPAAGSFSVNFDLKPAAAYICRVSSQGVIQTRHFIATK
jgi:hypothetical protein